MRPLRSRARGLAVIAAIVAPCLAGPPMITDDPGTTEFRHFEVNVPYTLTESRRGTEMEAPLLDINYGFTEHLQLNYAVAWLVEDTAGPTEAGQPHGEHSGLSNSEVGFKWRFLDQDKAGLDLSIHPAFEFNNPTRSRRRHLVEGGSVLTLPVQIGHDFGKYEIFADLGYQFVQHAEDATFAGICAGYKVSDRLELFAELFTTFDNSFQHPEPLLNVGLTCTVTDHLNFLFSVGRSLDDTPTSPEILLYAGVQFLF